MQKAVRVNEGQLLYLAMKAKQQNATSGYLYKKSADTGKWQLRWFVLYQNMLFYYENDSAVRPSGICLLEGCYCERVVLPATLKVIKGETDKQVRILPELPMMILVLCVCYLLVLFCFRCCVLSG